LTMSCLPMTSLSNSVMALSVHWPLLLDDITYKQWTLFVNNTQQPEYESIRVLEGLSVWRLTSYTHGIRLKQTSQSI
jgi:hypothetical protein